MSAIILYTDTKHYNRKYRSELIDILKPFLDKGEKFTDEDRKTMYGISEKELQLSNELEQSTLAVLPMSWNHYYKHGLIKQATTFITEAGSKGKKVISFTSGDFGVKVPHFNNLVVLRASGLKSNLPEYHSGYPIFIGDPLKNIYQTDSINLRSKATKPIIGFCGQADGNWYKYLVEFSRTSLRNLAYYFGLSHAEPQNLFPAILLRSKILHQIEKDTNIISNFIKRKKYRAGASNAETKQKTTREFFDNIVESDYIVCVRGTGNFSVRLYETLAMGRIPVFVNTNCLLPLAETINWKKHVVWVEAEELYNIGEKIIYFHNKLDELQFQELLKSNRELWLKKLMIGPFYKEFIKTLLK